VHGLKIVSASSSHPGVGADPVPLDQDHISIAKPRARDAQVCEAAGRILRDFVLKPRVSPKPRLYELPPAADEFFGRQAELAQVTERLRLGKNTAIVGAAGMGKTALAAKALEACGNAPFEDGIAYLDFYQFHGKAEEAWNSLANKLAGPDFMERATARERATNACTGRKVLVIVEGGEEADGSTGRDSIGEFLSALSPQNRWLLLTRLSTQAKATDSVFLRETLHRSDAARLLDSITKGRVTDELRERVLDLLDGHPLALTWAGNSIALDDDGPERLVADWAKAGLPQLSDPTQAQHTLEWLFKRSVRGLDETARHVLAAAALLARAPFPLTAMSAAFPEAEEGDLRRSVRELVRSSLLRRAEEEDCWQFTHVLGYQFARQETGSDAGVRRRLGEWLHQRLAAALEVGATAIDALVLTRWLQHFGALLRTDDDQGLWMPLVEDTLYEFVERLTILGPLNPVKLALEGVAGWFGRFPPAKAQEMCWARERSSLISAQGDVLSSEGNPTGALAAHHESLAVRRSLAEADPLEARRHRDLFVSLVKVGEVLGEQGDLPEALSAYREALSGIQGLTEADPSIEVWGHELFTIQAKIGDLLADQRDLPEAWEAYRGSLRVWRGLVAADRSNAGWQRNLSVIQERIGDLLRMQGELTRALAAYQASLVVKLGLSEVDPLNAELQRDISLILARIAQVLDREGDWMEALPLAEESLAIAERLVSLDVRNATWRKDVEISRALVARLRGKAAGGGVS